MSIVSAGFHPSFDALSTFADQPDLDAARSRTGRHVARCASCRATVDGIRAMGEAARAVELPGAPAGLWETIDRARLVETPAVARIAGVDATPPVTRRIARRTAIALLAAAALLGALLLPSPFHRTLNAATGHGRWRFSPARPAAGELVRVRYEPPASLPSLDRLLLLARDVPSWRRAAEQDGYGMALMDSVATLARSGDGAYVGQLRTPADFSALDLRLTPPGGGFFPTRPDSTATASRVDGVANRPATLLVARAGDGRPSLEALSSVVARGGDRGSRGDYSVADTLMRYYPAEPIGFAADRRVAGRRLLDDVIAWFRRGERQYTRFAAQYVKEPVVSADRELGMMMLGERISEPTEARGWVMRLVRDHPDDPRTLLAYSQMLYGMFNEPGTMPLIRRGLPLADTLWERNGHRGPAGELASIAGRAGDTAAVARWAMRSWEASTTPGAIGAAFDPALLRERSLRPAAERYLERVASTSCEPAAGRYPVFLSRNFWRSECAGRRRDAYASLSLLSRLEGRSRTALAYADTAVRLPGFAGSCWYLLPQQRRGEALLAVGDTVAALPELGLRAARDAGASYADSVLGSIHGSVDSATWSRALAAGRDSLARCRATEAEQRRAEAARLRAAGAPKYYR